jgi:hypothetical protein
MRDAIAFALGNFTLTFFVLGLLGSAIALWRTRQPRTSAVVLEALFSYFLLFSIAFANLYNFVLHVFFGKVAAAFIGWEDSPFQLEVGFASLGFAALGLLAFKGSLDLRLAAIVGPACFLWGAAGGHVFQMMSAQFCPRQCWRHFLQRCLGSDLGLHISLATKQCRPDISAAMRAKRSMRERLHRQAVDGRTNREHSPRPTLAPSAVEKHDGAGESGDVAGAWD